MTRIRIKRVYEAPAPDDGCRVLVDRLWPRGVRRDALHCDVWARDLAPSAGLRSWYHADPGDRWEEFRPGTPTSCVRRRPCGSSSAE